MAAIVIAIPHAGVDLPYGMASTMLPHVDERFLRGQSDVFTDRVYQVPGVRTVKYPWHRFVVDPNRAPRQETEGGVVPTTDFDEQPLYRQGAAPDRAEVERRISQYHRPYHQRVEEACRDPRSKFFIDGHSMMSTAPFRSPDHGLPRPDAVISNIGDSHANPSPGTPFLTCPAPLTRWLADRLIWWLTHVPAPEAGERHRPTGEVTLNVPFKGGFGVRTHSSMSNDRPGVQLELNQRLYADEETWVPLERRIPWMREVLRRWCEEITERLVSEPKFASRAG